MKPSMQDVVMWMKCSWHKITDKRVVNGPQAVYTDKKCSFKERSLAGRERLEPMVLQEMESQEIQTSIRDLEIYESGPEEDDVTIFE